jgi:hypothetical protein
MRFFRWLFDASGFKAPMACGGWSPALVRMSVASNSLLWLVYTTIPVLLRRLERLQRKLLTIIRQLDPDHDTPRELS